MKILLIFVLLTLIGCHSQTTENKANIAQSKPVAEAAAYVCPMNCENKTYAEAGICPVCKMDLVKEVKMVQGKHAHNHELTVCFYLQDNVEVLDFAGPLEVFTVAGFHVFTVSKTQHPIKTQGVLTMIPEFSIENAPPADVMVFFGGSHGAPSNDPKVIAWIQSRTKSTEYFMSVCTGAFIMGRAGLLDGLSATCYHTQMRHCKRLCPKQKS
jgi:putative intracellular protease/amidase